MLSQNLGLVKFSSKFDGNSNCDCLNPVNRAHMAPRIECLVFKKKN
jgi:hypothetical protein